MPVKNPPESLQPDLALEQENGVLPKFDDDQPVTRRMIAGIIETTIQRTHFQGPIPHPDIFRQYGEVIPDAPERILRVFEEDSRHAREIQVAALLAQKEDNRRVHWIAFSLISFGYILSVVFALMKEEWLAGIILTTTIIGTVTGFLQNRKSMKPSQVESDPSTSVPSVDKT